MPKIKKMTICFLVKQDSEGNALVCLAKKKRGYRVGKINGYGGKQELGETLEETAYRELIEESGVKKAKLNKVAKIDFCDPDLTHECHVYLSNSWEGAPVETEEMTPEWHPITKIPFDRMGAADPHWIPHVLEGKLVHAVFHYNDANIMTKVDVRILKSIEEI